MTPLEKLKSILENEYKSEDEEIFKIELLDGMSKDEIDNFRNQLPSKYLPPDIESLLKFSKGFQFLPFEEIRFDTYGYFGFEEMFPDSIQLAGDGLGNFWIVDIDSEGNWNSIYYVCHDPAVVVKHSNSLAEFIGHIDEFGKIGRRSHLDKIHEIIVFDIWQQKKGIMELNENDYNFELNEIQLPEMFLVADLTDKPITTGFPWGKWGASAKIIRPTDKPIWIVEKKVKQGFLARIFGSKSK